MSLAFLSLTIYIIGTTLEVIYLSLDLENTIYVANKVWNNPSRFKMSVMLSLVALFWPISVIDMMYRIYKDD